jgi:hypothetical protein
MKEGLALMHKIRSDLKEKECCKRIVNIERGNGGMETKLGLGLHR